MPIFSYYKIVSKDENIKDCYVGKTTNFKRRVIQHKSVCYNENCYEYYYKLYEYIRENGGWDNFDIIEIETNEYDEKDSAIRERYWIEELNANLNITIPSKTKEEWSKEYIKKNKEKIKEYNYKNIDKVREYKKKYRNNNIETILCECGGKYQLYSKARHFKTKLHQEYLLNEIN